MFLRNSSEKKSKISFDMYFNIFYYNNKLETISLLRLNKKISMLNISKIDIYGLSGKFFSFNKNHNHLILDIELVENHTILFENYYRDIKDEYECKLCTYEKIKYDSTRVTIER